jgi:hypothetical protein
MPAMDIVNLQENEADSTKDLSLAFIGMSLSLFFFCFAVAFRI